MNYIESVGREVVENFGNFKLGNYSLNLDLKNWFEFLRLLPLDKIIYSYDIILVSTEIWDKVQWRGSFLEKTRKYVDQNEILHNIGFVNVVWYRIGFHEDSIPITEIYWVIGENL